MSARLLGGQRLGVDAGRTTQPVTQAMGQIKAQARHFSNLAMCHLKLGNVLKARDNSSKALAIDGKNIKALFRRQVQLAARLARRGQGRL